MSEFLQNYLNARKELAEYFDDAPIWHNVIINIEDHWTDFGEKHRSVAWDYQRDEDSERDSGEFEYGMEVYGTSRWLSKDGKYTLFVGDDGCGNRDCYIFLNENLISDV